jgi:hypothetical protein
VTADRINDRHQIANCGAHGTGNAGQTAEAVGTDKVQPSDALDSVIVDSVISRYGNKLSPTLAETLPTAISCGGNVITAFATQNLTTDGNGTEILFDQTDGDQVGGLFFSTADLVALAAGKVTEIPIKSYHGFWWSDGNHYRFSNSSCKLHAK